MPKSKAPRRIVLWRKVAALLADRKAGQIEVLDFSKQSYFTDLVMIATAASPSHLSALHAAVTDLLEGEGVARLPAATAPSSGWMVVDAGALVVHLFLEETRQFYRLESLFGEVNRLKV
jgi:ribosome-associated protein